jgi:hypothetical protein
VRSETRVEKDMVVDVDGEVEVEGGEGAGCKEIAGEKG